MSFDWGLGDKRPFGYINSNDPLNVVSADALDEAGSPQFGYMEKGGMQHSEHVAKDQPNTLRPLE